MTQNNSLIVRLTDLARAFEIIAENIRRTRGEVIELNEDYYWELAQSQLYDPTREPSEFSFGQLSHDVERLRQILNGDAPAIGASMVWLGAVLRAIGQNIPPN